MTVSLYKHKIGILYSCIIQMILRNIIKCNTCIQAQLLLNIKSIIRK